MPFGDLKDKEIEEFFKLNIVSHIKLTNKIYPIFVKNGSGTIVNISSVAGIRPVLHGTLYSSVKYGLKGFTDSLRIEAKKKNIRVIGVYPEGIKTELYLKTVKKEDFESTISPEEISQLIFDVTKKYQSLNLDDLIVSRMNY
mgnify:CR=1 FL=1